LGTPEGKLWVERADHYAAPDSIERVQADDFLAIFKRMHDETAEPLRLLKHGIDLARRLGDNETFLVVASRWLFFASPREDALERQSLVEEIMQRPGTGIGDRPLLVLLFYLANFFVGVGQRRQAEEIIAELRTLAERSRQVSILQANTMWQSVLATLDGRQESPQTQRGFSQLG